LNENEAKIKRILSFQIGYFCTLISHIIFKQEVVMLPKDAILIAVIVASAPDLYENLKVRISSSFSEQETELDANMPSLGTASEKLEDEKEAQSDSDKNPNKA
jgi:hypothetical protein